MKKVILPGILLGVVITIIAMGLGYLMNLIFPSLAGEYNNVNLFRPWSDPLMSIYFAYPFVMGIAFAWVWNKVKSLFSCGNAACKGFCFGFAFFLVSIVPGMIITYSSFQISLLMTLTWTFGCLIYGIISGMILAKLNK